MQSGKYIVIEGNDGTGKSTQVELLARYLADRGEKVMTIHEPAGTAMADAIRTVIKNGSIPRDGLTNLLLFTASRHDIWQEASQKLRDGWYVLSARNYISTLAYQGAGEGIDGVLIRQLTEQFTDERYMKTDATIVLTTDSAHRRQRIAQRGSLDKPDTFEARSDDFQTRVNRAYRTIAAESHYPLIDASQSIEAVQKDVRDALGLDN